MAGEQVVLLLEDHHLVSSDILETVNSLLMAGEVGSESRANVSFLRDICTNVALLLLLRSLKIFTMNNE